MMARKKPTIPKPLECSLCGTRDGTIHPCSGGYVCLPCLEYGRKGRDKTTKAARAMTYSMGQRSVAAQLREWGDDASADTHEAYADDHAGTAAELLDLKDVPLVALGEVVQPKRSRLTDTLKLPDVAALDASAHRLVLLDRMGNDCAAMAIDAAASIKAENSLEKMLAHQLAVAHKTALEITDKATFMQDTVEKTRMLNLACRMMETYQRGLLTLQRLRSNGEQRITVQYVTVTDGGQAIIGNVDHRGGAKE
ncbi:MAG: hypothetical protein HY847_12390 [Betaproteobacteria bacterium]|nr:hypothetical protein [Betaproteobacteria bacterium]